MRKFTLRNAVAAGLLGVVLLQSCKNDFEMTAAPPVPNQSFTEEFDTVSMSYGRGWIPQNTGTRLGDIRSLIWQQGGDIVPFFPAFSSNGAFAGFIGTTATVTGLPATPPAFPVMISNWLISPLVTMQNGDKIVFYARGKFFDATSDYGNRLQLRANLQNESTNVGNESSVGDFTTALLDINPTYISQTPGGTVFGAFPLQWTRFEATISGINEPKRGRFAFRFLIEDAYNNGGGVGIDRVQYLSANR